MWHGLQHNDEEPETAYTPMVDSDFHLKHLAIILTDTDKARALAYIP